MGLLHSIKNTLSKTAGRWSYKRLWLKRSLWDKLIVGLIYTNKEKNIKEILNNKYHSMIGVTIEELIYLHHKSYPWADDQLVDEGICTEKELVNIINENKGKSA